jgi:hypothetical protein
MTCITLLLYRGNFWVKRIFSEFRCVAWKRALRNNVVPMTRSLRNAAYKLRFWLSPDGRIYLLYIYIYTYRYIHIPYMGQDPGPAPLRGATHMFTHLCGPPQRPRARVRAHVRYMYVSMRMHRYMYSYMYAFRSMFRSISISISILDRFHFYEAHQRSTFYHVIHIYSRCNWKHTHT